MVEWMDPDGSLGQRLQSVRIRRGLSLRSLADTAGCTASTISQIENGRSLPSVTLLVTLCDLLRISADDLLGRQLPLAMLASWTLPDSMSERNMLDLGGFDVPSGERFDRHPGGECTCLLELIYVVSGEIVVQSPSGTLALGEGSSVELIGPREVTFFNRREVDARVVWGRIVWPGADALSSRASTEAAVGA